MKDPKEKAAELVDKFYQSQVEVLSKNGTAPLDLIEYQIAIKSALIAVNENINSTFSKNWYNKKRIIPADYLTTDYWIEVKNELLKLQKS
jgi:hypothetical protein